MRNNDKEFDWLRENVRILAWNRQIDTAPQSQYIARSWSNNETGEYCIDDKGREFVVENRLLGY